MPAVQQVPGTQLPPTFDRLLLQSTMFNALCENAKAQAANFPFCTIEPNVGIVAVPDPRLDVLRCALVGAGGCCGLLGAAESWWLSSMAGLHDGCRAWLN